MPPAPVEEEPLSEVLRREPELLMVGFFLDRQEFVVPTLTVQEVIRFVAPTRLPAAPRFVAGVINLRGRVTPLVRLRDLLDIPANEGGERSVHHCLSPQRLAARPDDRTGAHHVQGAAGERRLGCGKTHLGTNVEFISGLLKLRENLVGIVSVDKIVETIITS